MAEKEYIERNALIAEYDRVHVGAPGGARKLMVEAPAADVVEVVRCEDCKHCQKRPTTDKIKMCANNQWVMECYPLVHDNDFCSYGERKKRNLKGETSWKLKSNICAISPRSVRQREVIGLTFVQGKPWR